MFIYQNGNGIGPMFAMGFKEFIKSSFKNGSVVTKLIYINIAVYLATKVGLIPAYFMSVTKVEYFSFLNSILDLPGSIEAYKLAPWSAVTYMFVHYGVLHLLFNMILLFWCGRALKRELSDGAVLALYIAGGLVGAAAYVFVAPKFGTTTHLAGASAAVMAILSAYCVWGWREQVQILLLGTVKVLYVLLFIVGFELLQLFNPIGGGSAVVHLGGAIVGVLVGVALIFFKPSPKTDESEFHWEGGYAKTEESTGQEKRVSEDRINEILDKVSERGYDSLTPQEKSILFKSGQR